jgi:hypothetical protein
MNASDTRTDFPDWPGPVLVKELRQGLRSKIFVAAFYLAQGLMILSVALNLSAVGSADTPQPSILALMDGVFWLLIAIPLLFLMPFRGFGALHSEIKSRTLELVFLTRLTAWRIAAAKWGAIVLQTVLLTCAVMPYVMLRYFLGGVDLVDDLQKVFLLLLVSAVLTAVTIAMSPFESKLARALFVVAMLFALQFILGGLLAWMAVGRVAGGAVAGPVWHTYLGGFLFFVPLVLLALEFAASRIAPLAENHAIRKRLLALAVLALGGTIGTLLPELEWILYLGLVFCAPVIVDALAGNQQPVQSIYSPFFRHGRPGELAAAFLTPGWPSGTWFALLTMAIAGIAAFVSGVLDDDLTRISFLAFFGALVFPAAFVRAVMPRTAHFAGFYIGIQCFLAVATVMVMIISALSKESLVAWISWIPTCTFVLAFSDQIPTDQRELVFALSAIGTTVAFGALILLGQKPLRDIFAAMRKHAGVL